MEVRSNPHLPGSRRARRSLAFLIDQGELRSILSNLSHELCRPLVSLRAGFDLLLGESPRTITDDQRGHLLTMVSLCDDLLRLTRSYLDYAGIVQGSRPVCLGSFTIGALIGEIDRQFAPVARGRQLDWEARAGLSGASWWSPTPRAASRFSAISSPTPEIHACRGTGSRHRESRGRFLVGHRLGFWARHSRRGPRPGLRAVLPPVAR